MLTDKEKEALANLPRNFNINKEDADYHYLASRRLDISPKLTRRLLKFSFALNCLSILLIVVSVFLSIRKPSPEFYASAPSGKIYHLKKLR